MPIFAELLHPTFQYLVLYVFTNFDARIVFFRDLLFTQHFLFLRSLLFRFSIHCKLLRMFGSIYVSLNIYACTFILVIGKVITNFVLDNIKYILKFFWKMFLDVHNFTFFIAFSTFCKETKFASRDQSSKKFSSPLSH